jgi:SSS family solute:Na+ symporter
MTPLDWGILVAVFLVMLVGVLLSRGQMKSVADFLAANRTAGRYLISVAGGIAAFGAISIVRDMEMNYIAGFSMSWWGLTMSVIVLLVTVSGWVIYRFRQTRCLTLAEFFERRYSRRFRVFAGLIVFLAGLLNFGIFPSVGARFFIHFCGLPTEVGILGMAIPTFPLTMLVLLGVSLFFVFAGGQVAVIVTDFIQGLFVAVVFLALTLYLLAAIGWDPLFEALEAAPKDASLINPFDTKNIPDFNFWFFLISVAIVLYGPLGWQGTQAYNVSAKSAHEAKMGGVLGMWRGFPQGLFILLVPMLVYTVMHHASFTAEAARIDGVLAQVGQGLEGKPLETVRNQMRAPLALTTLLPPGLIGAFAAVMFAAFVHDPRHLPALLGQRLRAGRDPAVPEEAALPEAPPAAAAALHRRRGRVHLRLEHGLPAQRGHRALLRHHRRHLRRRRGGGDHRRASTRGGGRRGRRGRRS